MNALGVWAGLSDSVFLADVDDRERDGARVAMAVVAGFVVGVAAALAGLLLVIIVYALLIGDGARGAQAISDVALSLSDPRDIGVGVTVARLAVATAADAVFLVVFVAVAAALARRPLHVYVTAAVQIRWRLLAMGFALAVLLLSPAVILERLVGAEVGAPPVLAIAPDLGARVIYTLSALLLIPAAAAEELFFRGWMMRQIAGLIRRPAMLIGVSAVAFAALHFDFNPDAFLTRALMGAGFAYMTLRLGGIEFSSGVHSVNNMLIVLFVQPISTEINEPSGLSALSLIEDAFLLGGYVAIAEAVARITVLRRIAGVRLEELSPAHGVTANVG